MPMKRTRPWEFRNAASSSGISARQGVHHDAQKLMTSGVPLSDANETTVPGDVTLGSVKDGAGLPVRPTSGVCPTVDVPDAATSAAPAKSAINAAITAIIGQRLRWTAEPIGPTVFTRSSSISPPAKSRELGRGTVTDRAHSPSGRYRQVTGVGRCQSSDGNRYELVTWGVVATEPNQSTISWCEASTIVAGSPVNARPLT